MGLIYKAVEDSAFEAEVEELSHTLASMPTRGLGLTKGRSCRPKQQLNDQLALELDLQFQAAETEDYREGVQAFLDKRKPTFVGR